MVGKCCRLAIVCIAVCILQTHPTRSQTPEIFIGPPDPEHATPPQFEAEPENYLAKCLANPDDRISCEIAKSRTSEGGLESADISTAAYVRCAGSVCLELATLDLDEATSNDRLPSVDITISFDYDKADVRRDQAGKLVELARALQHASARDAKFAVIGHTDAVGSEAFNCRLSHRRADAVAASLVKQGVAQDRLRIVSAGEHVPKNTEEETSEENRRVGFARLGTSGGDEIFKQLAELCDQDG